MRPASPSLPITALLAAAFLLLGGCAAVPEGCTRPVGDRSLTPEVAAGRGGATGKRVTSACGRPRTDGRAQGRFILRRPGYLETADLRPGREITASGRITEIRAGRIGEADYRFPVLEDARPRIWPEGTAYAPPAVRPWVSIGIGSGGGWSGGGVGVVF
jgi:outer membrane lipoprotein